MTATFKLPLRVCEDYDRRWREFSYCIKDAEGRRFGEFANAAFPLAIVHAVNVHDKQAAVVEVAKALLKIGGMKLKRIDGTTLADIGGVEWDALAAAVEEAEK